MEILPYTYISTYLLDKVILSLYPKHLLVPKYHDLTLLESTLTLLLFFFFSRLRTDLSLLDTGGGIQVFWLEGRWNVSYIQNWKYNVNEFLFCSNLLLLCSVWTLICNLKKENGRGKWWSWLCSTLQIFKIVNT